MKKLTLLILLSAISLLSNAQQQTVFDVGIGYPLFFKKNFNAKTGGDHSIDPERISASAEFPDILNLKESPGISVIPGAGYFNFKEYEITGALGGGFSTNYKHEAVSLYAKLNWYYKKHTENAVQFYSGLLCGFYAYSNTSGSYFKWGPGSDGYYNETIMVDKSGRDFFRAGYFALYSGFSMPECPVKFEVTFSPFYANIHDGSSSPENDKNNGSMVMLSARFGLVQKKATRTNE